MAPEQALGEPLAASDQYSLGVVFYELLTGQPPFAGRPQLVPFLHQTQQPPRPVRDGRGVPRDLEAICLKAMAKQAAGRYGSCEALSEDLGRFLNCEPVLARRTPPPERLAKWAQRRPAQAALAGVSVLAALSAFGGAGFYALYKDQQAETFRTRLEKVRKVEDLRERGGEEEAAGRLAAAMGLYEQAAALLDADPGTREGVDGDTRERRDRVAAKVRQQQEDEADRREWGERIARFRRNRDDILFYAIPFGEDAPAVKRAPPRPAIGRRRGGQLGHQFYGRALLPPDHVHALKPAACCGCGVAVRYDKKKLTHIVPHAGDVSRGRVGGGYVTRAEWRKREARE